MKHWTLRAALAAWAWLPLVGCSTYDPKPLVEKEVLRDLQAITLEALKPTASSPSIVPRRETFDPSDGVSADEAVAVALFLNPDLRAFRKEREVAEGELVAAGLLPNPELQVAYVFLDNFTKTLPSSGFDISLNWAPPRPGEIGAKEARARARIDEVRAEISVEEWRLAADVRKAHVALWTAEERFKLFDASLKIRERIRTFVRSKRKLGDANRLDENLVEIEYAETLREWTAVTNERERASLELNRLLGLPPRLPLRLQATDPIGYREFKLEPAALELIMIERRPQIVAAKHEYQQAENELNLAYIQRWPWFRFGPTFMRDELAGRIQNRFGVGIGIDLPIANQNQGEIAIGEARRERLKQAFVAKIHAGRAEVNEAYRSLRAHERLIKVFLDSIKPALDENAALTETGFEKGEFNLVQLITTQDKVLRSRREFLEAQVGYWQAAFELERALGERFTAPPEKE